MKNPQIIRSEAGVYIDVPSGVSGCKVAAWKKANAELIKQAKAEFKAGIYKPFKMQENESSL